MKIFQSFLHTPIGEMTMYATEGELVLLEFKNRKNLSEEIQDLVEELDGEVSANSNEVIDLVKSELTAYFNGSLKEFTVPIRMTGTDFQKQVWSRLLEVPHGKKLTYKDQAKSMGNPEVIRAMAHANGQNKIAIIIPCHRVIGSNGDLTGYAGGMEKKQWLLEHEGNQMSLF